jgi:hypothetical protein
MAMRIHVPQSVSSRRLFRAGAAAGAILSASAAPSLSAESGVGFYLLGSRGPAAGVVPPPGTYFQNDLYFYSGSASADLELPIAESIVLDVEADAAINLSTVLWSTETMLFGGNLAYSLTVPFGWQDVSAELSLGGLGVGDDIFAIGDPVLGAQIGWHDGKLHYTLASLVNVPIGQYLANVAFNRWGADLTFAASYIDPATGLDISAAVGITVNGENEDTDYRTGNEFHGEWAITKAFSPAFSAGVLGYYYDQFTPDSGTGAVLGGFEGQVSAVGLTAAYNFAVAERPVSLRVKAFREFDARNRLEGNSVFLTLSLPL